MLQVHGKPLIPSVEHVSDIFDLWIGKNNSCKHSVCVWNKLFIIIAMSRADIIYDTLKQSALHFTQTTDHSV